MQLLLKIQIAGMHRISEYSLMIRLGSVEVNKFPKATGLICQETSKLSLLFAQAVLRHLL